MHVENARTARAPRAHRARTARAPFSEGGRAGGREEEEEEEEEEMWHLRGHPDGGCSRSTLHHIKLCEGQHWGCSV